MVVCGGRLGTTGKGICTWSLGNAIIRADVRGRGKRFVPGEAIIFSQVQSTRHAV